MKKTNVKQLFYSILYVILFFICFKYFLSFAHFSNKLLDGVINIIEIVIFIVLIQKNLNIVRDLIKAIQLVSNNLFISTESTSQSVQEIAAATEQTSASLQDMSNNISNISHSSNQIVMNVEDLASMSADINSILTVINEISSRTNLLALNAAIEAARVGENGKGFSVVANEVDKLSTESKHSSKEIENIISKIKLKIDDINCIVRTNDNNISTITATMQQIAAASEQQSASIEGVSNNSEQIKEMATELKEINEKFKI